MDNVEALNKYIDDVCAYRRGENDDFQPIAIPTEVDDEMQKESLY